MDQNTGSDPSDQGLHPFAQASEAYKYLLEAMDNGPEGLSKGGIGIDELLSSSIMIHQSSM